MLEQPIKTDIINSNDIQMFSWFSAVIELGSSRTYHLNGFLCLKMVDVGGRNGKF